MHETYEFHQQVHRDRLQTADEAALRRQLITQRRARRRLERAEQAARQARLVLASSGDTSSSRLTGRHA